MMRIFAVDQNNDLHLSPAGSLAINKDRTALMQACEHAMQALLNEMVFAQGRGLPYQETIWIGSPNLRLFEDASRRALSSITGVQSVASFEASAADHVLTYRATIKSIYGETPITGAVDV